MITKFLFPLLIAGSTGYGLIILGGRYTDNNEFLWVIALVALLIHALLTLIPKYILQAAVQEGFAIINDKELRLPEELSLARLLSNSISGWVPFSQPLDTTICFVAPGEWRYIDISIDRHFSRNKEGKLLAQKREKSLPLLEERLQNTIFSSSRVDSSFSEFFEKNKLMNETDIQTFKSKLLSSIEADSPTGIEYSYDPNSIRINSKTLRRVKKNIIESAIEYDHEELDLELDFDNEFMDNLKL